ncbi:hypothetical protein F4780DRAFT_542374 [Xylariomycetidae sp. FL0641]|nr:hypothetical protein F4780DRAFT_542374 [Xylariomycetidae sp. FL0641]
MAALGRAPGTLGLRHIYLRPFLDASADARQRSAYPTYALATRCQTALQQRLLAWKGQPAGARGPPPDPAVLSFTPAPTYTLGRRQQPQQGAPLTADEEARLRAPLTVRRFPEYDDDDDDDEVEEGEDEEYRACPRALAPAVVPAPRGGLATYHGPGQLVLWPVVDLRSPRLRAPLGVRAYACLLEKTTMAAISRFGGGDGGDGDGPPLTFTTADPGVWTHRYRGNPDAGDARHCRKVAALGVHLRRHVTGLGVAINVDVPVAGPASVNPWARIVPCGLADKGVTRLADMDLPEVRQIDSFVTPALLAELWAREFMYRFYLHGGEPVGCDHHVSTDAVMGLVEAGRKPTLYLEYLGAAEVANLLGCEIGEVENEYVCPWE